MRFILVLFCFTYYIAVDAHSININDSIANADLKKESKHALYVGLGYGSDMVYSGISILSDQAYSSTDLTYSFNNLFTASLSLYNLAGVKPAIAFYDITLGLTHQFNNTVDAGASVAFYNTARQLETDYFGNSVYLTLSSGIDWYILYSKVSYSTMLNDKGSNYLQLSNSHYWTTKSFFSKKAHLWTDPSINLVFGNKIELIETTKGGGFPFSPINSAQPSTEYKTTFGLMDLEFSVPVAFSYQKTTLELTPLFYLPVHKDPDFPARTGLYFYASLYLKIP